MPPQRTRTTFDPAAAGWWPTPIDGSPSAGDRTPLRGRRRRRADVAVIGAGLSGLVAADRLARDGASVVVLEARDRVGGRIETAKLLGHPADLGGGWIGAGHSRTRALLAELGLDTYPTYDSGERVVVRRRGEPGRLRRRLTVRAVDGASERFEQLDGAVAGEDLALWLARCSRSPRARGVMRNMFVNVLGDEPEGMSLQHALDYVRSGGGLAALVGTAGGAQQDLVAGGAQAIATRLADRLGDAVELGAPVRGIETSATGVTITADRLRVEADTAVIALSPTLAAQVGFEPPVHHPALSSGDAIKCVAVYGDAFWRREGKSGMAWGDVLPFSFTRDISDPHGEPGLLAAFFVGQRARRLRGLHPSERDRVLTEALGRCFGPRALMPMAIVSRDWTADPWSLGGYGCAAPRHAASAPPEPQGRLIPAGTEAASEHQGYMEGAVRAGERAAAGVLRPA